MIPSWLFLVGLAWGTFAGFCFGCLLTLCLKPKMLYDISRFFASKRLAENRVSEHNKREAAETPAQTPETTRKSKADSPDSAHDKAKQTLADKKAELDRLAGVENQSLDLFDQINTKQREYAEEYYKVHKELPPGFVG